MAPQLEIAARRLFDKKGLAADNIKLFPGSSRDATPEEMAEQVNRAIAQIEVGEFKQIEDLD